MKAPRALPVGLALAALVCVPSISSADDRSLEAAYRGGAEAVERPTAELERAGRVIERTRSKRAFRRAGRRALRALRVLKGALASWRQATVREVPSSAVGAEAKQKALGAVDAMRAAANATERGVRLALRALRRGSERDLRRAEREFRRQRRHTERSEILQEEAEELFVQAASLNVR